MKSDVISIDNKGKGFQDVVDVTKNMAEFKKLDDKHSLQLQLCAEEMLSMIRTVTGEIQATYWVDCEDNKFDLNITTQTVMDKEKRNLLLSSSTSKKNEAAKGFLGMLRDSFEQALLAESDTVYYEMPDDVAADVAGRAIDDPEWDRYESSILRKIADDIRIAIRGGAVTMTVTKNF